MEHYSVFPNKRIVNAGQISETFLGLGITDFYISFHAMS